MLPFGQKHFCLEGYIEEEEKAMLNGKTCGLVYLKIQNFRVNNTTVIFLPKNNTTVILHGNLQAVYYP